MLILTLGFLATTALIALHKTSNAKPALIPVRVRVK